MNGWYLLHNATLVGEPVLQPVLYMYTPTTRKLPRSFYAVLCDEDTHSILEEAVENRLKYPCHIFVMLICHPDISVFCC